MTLFILDRLWNSLNIETAIKLLLFPNTQKMQLASCLYYDNSFLQLLIVLNILKLFCSAFTHSFLGVGKNFRLLMQSCCFFFSRPFHENFKFLKNCPYDFHEILHSHSTPKGAPACAKASKSYGWDVRNIAKISPKMAKKQPFFYFFRFSQTVHTIRTKFSTDNLHHIRVLYVQWHQNRMAGM